jgi:hypothetical protein
MKTNQRIVVISILASILLVPAVQASVFADEPYNLRTFKYLELPKGGALAQDATNNVGIRAAFHFVPGEEVIDSFKSFSTKSTGFDRSRGLVTVELQGVISNDKPLLYRAVDVTFEQGVSRNIHHDYKNFDFDLLFSHGEQPYRIFSYENCIVKNYNIDTLFDKEETFMGKTKFAYVENFEFECRGVQMWNPTYDKMKQEQQDEITADALKNLDRVKNGKQ